VLGPPQDNGGPTQTHALLAGSPAIDAVADCTDFAGIPVPTDQRDVARPQGPACDIGAFEFIPPCTITCPANIAQANDPNQCGAVVTYPPPMTTGTCGTVTCSPASGAFFPVGTTTVTCSTTAGPSCSFTITVLTPEPATQAIQSLIARVQALVAAGVLKPPQGTGLIAKLRDALDGLNRGNTRVACNKLADFISQVNALIGSGVLTPAEGAPLVQSATNIRNALGCS
jgi:hypothetical protein